MIAVCLILAFIVIPPVSRDTWSKAAPEQAAFGIGVVVFIHLLIVTALISSIISTLRGGLISKGLLIASGVALVLLGLLISDGAGAFLGHPGPEMHRAAVLMFYCVGFDIIAGLLAFFTAWYSRRLHT